MNITLLLTIYKPKKEELKFWIDFYKNYNKDIEMHFLVDSKKRTLKKKLIKNISKDNLFFNDSNKGKFRTIYDHVKLGNVKTTHIKNCDPDDMILFENIPDINLDENTSYTHGNMTLSYRPSETDQEELKKLVEGNWRMTTADFANHISIWPVKKIKEDKFYNLERIDAGEDKLFGSLCKFNGSKMELINQSFYFYINNPKSETGKNNIKSFLPSYLKTFSLILKIMEENNFGSPCDQDPVINWFNNNFSIIEDNYKTDKDQDYHDIKSKIISTIKKIKDMK